MESFTAKESVMTGATLDGKISAIYHIQGGPFARQRFTLHNQASVRAARTKLEQTLVCLIEQRYHVSIDRHQWQITYEPAERRLRTGGTVIEGSANSVVSSPPGTAA
jgi:hypothetical protein